jgi:nucleotidyltransferase substrate binding protein (TIGR01987 family)
MSAQDIRWIQRFKHFNNAFSQLQKAVELKKQRPLSELEEQGLIQAFEFTYELAWNTIKDYFEAQGETGITGSRDAFRLAFRRSLIEDGETWMDMIKSRILSSHTYNEDIAAKIVDDILNRYHPEFAVFRKKFESLRETAT